MGPFGRLRELIETLREAARTAQGAQRREEEYQPMPPVGSRGGEPARPPRRAREDGDDDAPRVVHRRSRASGADVNAATAGQRVRRMLSTRESLRDAIVARDVLGPPVGLRGRSARRFR